MKKIVMINALLLALCCAGLTCVSFAQELRSEAQPKQEKFQWRGRLAPNQLIEVQGVMGNIRVETTTGDEVEIIAVKRGRDNPGDVTIQALKHEGGVTLCALYPSDRPDQPYQCLPGAIGALLDVNTNIDRGRASVRFPNGGGDIRLVDVSVDFLARVPRGVRFAGLTVIGDVESRHTAGAVTAQSVYGDVRVELPAQASASVRAEATIGHVVSDFNLPIKARGQSGQFVRGDIGGGASKLTLKTVMGNIYLRQAR